MDAVILVEPSPDWPLLARREADRFAQALGDNLIRIHHIGSTSIPGIRAKPIVDLLPEVHSVQRLDEVREQIEALGYSYWGEYGLVGRRFCPRIDPILGRVANVHCYAQGDRGALRHLAFRDYLRRFPELAREYEACKLQAQALHPYDGQAYNDCKDGWIRATERAALDWVEKGRP